MPSRSGSDSVSCEPSDIDEYSRTVAVYRLGALDLNGWLVKESLALAYRRSSTAYVRHNDTRTGRGNGVRPAGDLHRHDHGLLKENATFHEALLLLQVERDTLRKKIDALSANKAAPEEMNS